MFESLKHWIASINDESKLFRDAEDEALHSALASLLYHFISIEKLHGGREKHEFDRVMKHEFDLNQQQVDHLYQAAKAATGDPHDDLLIIDSHMKDNPAVRMRFMQRLLQLINIHGAHPQELDLFYETLHEVFPDLKDVGANENI
jgi:uncharacterized tellurite resistance protein B-like protein